MLLIVFLRKDNLKLSKEGKSRLRRHAAGSFLYYRVEHSILPIVLPQRFHPSIPPIHQKLKYHHTSPSNRRTNRYSLNS